MTQLLEKFLEGENTSCSLKYSRATSEIILRSYWGIFGSKRTCSIADRFIVCGAQGPDPITFRELSRTSERTSTMSLPAVQEFASPPAFTLLAMHRIAFKVSISTPAFERFFVRAANAWSEIGARGDSSSAEAPPVTKTNARSSCSRDRSCFSISWVARMTASVGRLFPRARVSRSSTWSSWTAHPSGTLTRPCTLCFWRRSLPSRCSKPAAKPAAAFPPPTTQTLPVCLSSTAWLLTPETGWPSKVSTSFGDSRVSRSVRRRYGSVADVIADTIDWRCSRWWWMPFKVGNPVDVTHSFFTRKDYFWCNSREEKQGIAY